MKSLKKGFTLIELLIVIVIIGILATIAIVNYGGQSAKAKKAATVTLLNDAANAANICIAGGSTLAQGTAVTGGKTICTDTTVTSAVWPTTGANGYSWTGVATTTGDVVWTISGNVGADATAAPNTFITCPTIAGGSCK